MNREVFGVFGDRETLTRFRTAESFDEVVVGDEVAVGLADDELDVPGRSDCYDGPAGTCVLFGEAFAPDGDDEVARWTARRYAESGLGAFGGLNGSYVAVVDDGERARVVTDAMRSWEVFYADVDGGRVFSTDVSSIRSLVDRPAVRREALLEYLHVGTVFGDRTLFAGIDRVPFDGYLSSDGVGELSRFVYRPDEGEGNRRTLDDHAAALAHRLERALARRSGLPGPRGLLLSGGKDSRVFLSKLDIDRCYTIGDAGCREVRAATKVAAQYGADHTILEPDERYLRGDDRKIRYGQSIKESLHIHHAGYDDQFDVRTMYHGVLFDTLLKGYFLERDGVELFGSKLPSTRLAPDPDPVESLLSTLGYFPEDSPVVADAVSETFDGVRFDDGGSLHLDDPGEFLRERLQDELDRGDDRAGSVHNAMDLLVVRNQPVLPFRTHLADNYLECFVAADRDLLDWHLTTPPEHRRDATFWRALQRIDPSIFEHRPPSQPHASRRLNEIERFLRRKLPLLEPFEAAWPDRERLYDDCGLAEELFPGQTAIHDLPARLQLRVNDARWWTN
jgi:asparagine synthase (glutamine-hydrolysing)